MLVSETIYIVVAMAGSLFVGLIMGYNHALKTMYPRDRRGRFVKR